MSKYTIEKHGKGYAIYLGRDWQHHGANIGHLTEVTPTTIKLIEDKLNATLAQPEQEPVAFIEQLTGKPKLIGGYVVRTDADIPLYMTPSKREWVGLHLDDMPEEHVVDRSFLRGARWAEAKLKEKNGG